MSNEEVKVKMGAETSGLEAGAKRAERAMRDLGTAGQGALGGLERSAKQAEAGVNKSMGSLVEAVKGAVVGYASLATVRALATLADQASLLSARMAGVVGNTEQATVAQRDLFAMSQRLQASYTEVAASFARIMPAVKELGGGVAEATKLSEILISTARLSGSSTAEASASAMQFAQALSSGTLQGDELRSILENNNTLARELARSLGVTIGELRKMGSEGKLTSEVVAKALLGSYESIKSKTAELPPTIGGAMTQISNAFGLLVGSFEQGAGVFAYLGRIFGEVAKVIEIVAMRLKMTSKESDNLGNSSGAKDFARGVGLVFAYILDLVAEAIAAFKRVGEWIGALAAAAAALFRGDVAGAGEILREQWAKSAQGARDFTKAVMGAGQAVQAYLAVANSEGDYGNEGNRGASPKGAPGANLRGKPVVDENKTRMPQWEQQLADRRLHVAKMGEIDGTFRNMTKAEEERFWQDILAKEKLNAKEREAVTKKLTDLRLSEAERYNQSMQRAQETRREMERADAMAQVELEESRARGQLERGEITNQQYLARMKEFEQRKLQIIEAGLLAKIAMIDALDPDAPAKRAALDEQLLQAKLQFKQRVGEIDEAMVTDQQRITERMQQNFENAFMPVLQQFMRFQLSFVGLLKGLGQAVVSTFTTMLAQIIAKKLAAYAVEKTLAMADIGTKAAQAGAGAAASQAGIPVVGPGLALAAMGAVFAAVMGLAGKVGVPSAAGGFDIPAGMNPLTQLHEREMVLPAKHADVIRDMAEGGGGSMPPIHIHATDADSVRRLFENNGPALVNALRRQVRNFGALA